MAKAKRAKKRAAKNKDAGIRELLHLLETHPHLVRALLVDHAKVRRLLRTRAARRLLRGVAAPPPNPDPTVLYIEGRGDKNVTYPPPGVTFRCLKRSI